MLTQENIDAYNADGVFCLRGVLDDGLLTRLRDAVARDIAQPGPFYHGYEPETGGGKFHGNLRLWQHDPDFRNFCLGAPLPSLAAQLFGARKVNLLYDQLFVKEPGTANPTRWHNDQPYWAVRGWQVASFWLALDPVTKDSGALEFVRGSHKWNAWYQPEKFGDTAAHEEYEANPDYVPMPDIDAAREDYDIVSWDLDAGDAYVFHGLTIHGAGGNHRADTRRRGYTVRYTGDDAVYDTRPGTNEHLRHPTLVDGAPLDSDLFPVVWPAA